MLVGGVTSHIVPGCQPTDHRSYSTDRRSTRTTPNHLEEAEGRQCSFAIIADTELRAVDPTIWAGLVEAQTSASDEQPVATERRPASLGAAGGTEAQPASAAPGFVADELAKLVNLRNAGELTGEEFAELKRRLLGR